MTGSILRGIGSFYTVLADEDAQEYTLRAQKKLRHQKLTPMVGDRVRFTGYVPNERLPAYYRLADLVCVPTLVEEAAGLVAVEAMACGRPVLATRSGGMPEYLEGSQAILVDRGPELTAQLGWAIRMLCEHPELRRQMGEAGVRTAQRFSTAAYYDAFVRIVYDFLGLGPEPQAEHEVTPNE